MPRISFYITFLLLTVLVALTRPVKGRIKSVLGDHLVAIGHIPAGSHFHVAYILGGSPGSMFLKFRKAASLYKQGLFKTILVPHRSGITEYYPKFGRNLKNDEWSMMKLTEMGISSSDIEIVNINEGFFGTYSEAKTISGLVKKRGYTSILLITAPFHTRRTKLSFQNFLGPEVRLAVVPTQEKAGLFELLSETIKLTVYRFFLLTAHNPTLTAQAPITCVPGEG